MLVSFWVTFELRTLRASFLKRILLFDLNPSLKAVDAGLTVNAPNAQMRIAAELSPSGTDEERVHRLASL